MINDMKFNKKLYQMDISFDLYLYKLRKNIYLTDELNFKIN